jgi:hypothetical protein
MVKLWFTCPFCGKMVRFYVKGIFRKQIMMEVLE